MAAIDFWLEQDGSTHVTGFNDQLGQVTPFSSRSGSGRELYIAPALEYNFSDALGVIVGARLFAWGRNEPALATPVIAINYVH